MLRNAVLLALALSSACMNSPSNVELWEADVTISSTPEGAQVVWFRPDNVGEVNGPVELGVTPLTWEASRGLVGPADQLELVLFKPNYGRVTVSVAVEELRGGVPVNVEIPRFATLAVRSLPMATFELTDSDGVLISANEYAPELVGELTPGTYRLTATRDGYDDYDSIVVVNAGEAASVRIELNAADGPPDGEPRMSVLPAEVVGMSEFDFYDALRGQARNVANCIDRAMVEDPLAAGEVHVTLHLNLPFGTVHSTEITQAPFDDVEAIDCIQRRLRRVTYQAVSAESDAGTASFILRYHRITQ